MRCGVCGGGVHVYTRNRLACYASRGTGTCSNRLTIRRDEVETRILTALRDQLLNRELFEEFCREFAQEMNRLQSTERARQSAVRQELSAVKRDIAKLIEAIKNDVPLPQSRTNWSGWSTERPIWNRVSRQIPS